MNAKQACKESRQNKIKKDKEFLERQEARKKEAIKEIEDKITWTIKNGETSFRWFGIDCIDEDKLQVIIGWLNENHYLWKPIVYPKKWSIFTFWRKKETFGAFMDISWEIHCKEWRRDN